MHTLNGRAPSLLLLLVASCWTGAVALAQSAVFAPPQPVLVDPPPLVDALPTCPWAAPTSTAGTCGCGSRTPTNNLGQVSKLLPSMPGAPCVHDVGLPDVHLHSGEYHLEVVDLRIPGRGLDFVWGRRYRSRLGPDSAQGNRWDFSYNVSVQADGSDLLLADGSGRLDRYELQPDGSYVNKDFARRGTFIAGGKFELLFADRGRWVFKALGPGAQSGRLESIIDRHGNTIVLAYAVDGRLTTITDTLGRTVTIAYDAGGHITSVTDFSGRSVVYGYYDGSTLGGSAGDLKSARSPIVTGTPNGNDFPAGKTTTYTYSKGFSDDRLNHNLLTITDPKGQLLLSNTYASTTDAAAADFDHVVRVEQGGPAGALKLVYVPQLEPIALVLGLAMWRLTGPATHVTAITNDPLGHVVQYTYDASGRLLTLQQFTGSADPAQPTTLHVNRPGPPLHAGDPPAFKTTWEWSGVHPTAVHRPSGALTTITYPDSTNAPLAADSFTDLGWLKDQFLEPGDQDELHEAYVYASPPDGLGSNLLVQHTDPRGGVTTFVREPDGDVVTVQHRLPGIVESWEYNAFGQATAHVLPDNGSGWLRRDTFVYFAAGPAIGQLMKRTVDAQGAALVTAYEYDAVGNLTRITDPEGFDTQFIVNALGQVVRRISPEVTAGSGIRYQRDFYFDANDNLVRLDDQNKDANGVLQANAASTTTYEYDALSRLMRTTSEVDATHNQVEERVYDAEGGLIAYRSGQAVNGQQPDNVNTFVNDERHNLLRQTCGGAGGLVTQYDYSVDGRRIRETRGLGGEAAVTQFELDAFGREVTRTDPMGNVVTTHWSPNSRPVSERLDGQLVDVAGNAGAVRLREVHHVYDAMDRETLFDEVQVEADTQLAVGDGLGTSTITWSPAGKVLQSQDDIGNVTLSSYDTTGHHALQVDAMGNSWDWDLNNDGNLEQEARTQISGIGGPPLQSSTSYVYDGLGRLTEVHDPLGGVRRARWDSAGNRVEKSDALAGSGQIGNVVRRTYDGLGRLLTVDRVLTVNGKGDGQVIGHVITSQAWDDSSRLVSQTDGNGHATTYAYDACDRLVSTTFADGTSNTVLSVDSRGNVLTRMDARGTLITNTWDLLDRLVGVSIAPGPGVAATTTQETYSYDGAGRLVLATDNDAVVSNRYDTADHLITQTLNGETVEAEHDGTGFTVTLTYPGGLALSIEPDALGRAESVAYLACLTVLYYTGPHDVQRIDHGNGTRADFTYDANGLVTDTRHTQIVGGEVLDWRTYGHDAMDNTTSELNHVTQESTAWTYDSLSRLVRSDRVPQMGPTQTIAYAYDAAGNRTSVTGGPASGTYTQNAAAPNPADAQMNQYTTTPGANRSYDANGNLATLNDPAPGIWQYGYDYRNRLVSATRPGLTATFRYDALDRLVERTVNDGTPVTRRFFYLGNDPIEVQDELGVTRSVSIYGGRDLLLHRTTYAPAPSTIFHHLARYTDAEMVVAVTDSAGNVAERYRYDDFGLPTFLTPGGQVLAGTAVGNDILYHERRWEPALRLYDLRGRWLDPLAGRFVTRDPIGLWGDEDNLGNPFTIVGNNPRTYADSTGLYKDVDLHSCSSSGSDPQTSDCYEAASLAEDYAADGEAHFDSHKTSERDTCYWYVRWFGEYKQSRYNFVRTSVLDDIGDKFGGTTVDIECEDPDYPTSTTVAWVKSDDPKWIHLAPNTGANAYFFDFDDLDQAAIVVHEMAHEVNNSVDDIRYGALADLCLAENYPCCAAYNADNYEEFIKDFEN